MKPKLLDCYCGAGGCAKGYKDAGFFVVGIDINPQPHYPYPFILGDVLEILPRMIAGEKFLASNGHWYGLSDFAAIHASPPCQGYTKKPAAWGRKRTHWLEHPDLLDSTRKLLIKVGKPYVLENVPGAPINGALMLCGTMFGLRIQKHRFFESNISLPLSPATCDHRDTYNPWQGKGRSADKLRAAQDTPWIPMSGGASRKMGITGDLFNAIPPAYTEFIGAQLLRVLNPSVSARDE